LTLSIERVDFIPLVIIKALIREVLAGAIKNDGLDFSFNGPVFEVVDEVVMGKRVVVKHIHKYSVMAYVRAGREGLWE